MIDRPDKKAAFVAAPLRLRRSQASSSQAVHITGAEAKA